LAARTPESGKATVWGDFLRFEAGMDSAADYIDDLQTNGRLAVTTDEAVQALGKSVPAVRAQLRRLK
jgi:hypothetical protein